MGEFHDIVRAQLRIDEGVRSKPYRDSVGKLTIGVGRNLDDVGLSAEEIVGLLDNDIAVAESVARTLFPGFDALSENRKAALVNMAFNLGQERLAGFHDMRSAIAAGDFARAGQAMRDSRWAAQVGPRAVRLERMMREG